MTSAPRPSVNRRTSSTKLAERESTVWSAPAARAKARRSGVPGAADHPCPQVPRHLNGGQAGAACGAVYQDRLAGTQPGRVHQPVVGGEQGNERSGQFGSRVGSELFDCAIGGDRP